MTPTIRPRARDDIIRQFRWYLVEREVPETAQRFLDSVRMTIERIAEMPGVGAPKRLGGTALAGLRSCPVDGFDNIRVYYLASGATLRILRVLHGARDVGAILETETDSEKPSH